MGQKKPKGKKSIVSYAFRREYVSPSVSMYSNTIQNIDSVLLGKAMLENPEVLAIYDALMSNITDAVGNADSYNKAFKDVSADFSILKNALKRLQSVKGNSINIKEVNKVVTAKLHEEYETSNISGDQN